MLKSLPFALETGLHCVLGRMGNAISASSAEYESGEAYVKSGLFESTAHSPKA